MAKGHAGKVKQLPSAEQKRQERLSVLAGDVRSFVRGAVGNVQLIGERLTEAKDLVPHGEWGSWLKTEFDWSERTAQRYIKVAELLKNVNLKNDTVSDLNVDLKALYLLAQRKTPEPVREAALQMAKTQHVSHASVTAMLKRYLPPPPPTPKEIARDKALEREAEIGLRKQGPLEWAAAINLDLETFLFRMDEEYTNCCQLYWELPLDEFINGIAGYARRDELMARVEKARLFLSQIERGVNGRKLKLVAASA